MSYGAVFCDVGGVLHLPDPARVTEALRAAGAEAETDLFERAHYVGIAEVDALPAEAPDDRIWGSFFRGYARGTGVPDERVADAVEALRAAFRRPGMWSHVRQAEVEALRALARTGVPVAIVSNSDGTLEGRLREEGTCQVGEGRGVPVAAVIDSGAVGTSKPDPRIFELALEAVGCDRDGVVHVGDSVRADVLGALGAGLDALHLDPFGLCGADDHPHVRSLSGVVERVRR